VEGVDPFVPNPPEWSAIRISDYGYTEMTVHNNTHISFQQISSDKVINTINIRYSHHFNDSIAF
jgi:hypothetical protein